MPLPKVFVQEASSRIFLADSITALENLSVDVVIILAVGRYAGSGDSPEEYAAANAASYAKELIRGMSDGLNKSIESLRGTETIVPPRQDIEVPSFEPQQFPRHGEAVLLVIPTANMSKVRLLREAFERQKPRDAVVHLIAVPFDSGVGEQPYNEAGVLGAHNRISNALRHLNAREHQDMLASKEIGTVIVASIESYIQLDNTSRPTDYGLVVVHNATAGETAVGLSWGATVPPAYVDRARRFGFEGNPNHGRVTVGQILAAHVPGLDKAEYHSVLAGRSRYDLLSDVVGHLAIPW
jgi:non-canonical (house-cleaning) NTP pyrophosphatase